MKGLFLGLSTVDIQYLLPTYPAANSKHKTEPTVIDIGGPALNAAATFVHLGGGADFYTVLGQHALRGFMEERLATAGLRTIDLAPESQHLPTVASVWTSADTGDRTIVTNRRQDGPLALSLLPDSLDPTSIQILLLDGFHLAAAIALAQRGKQVGIPVVLDGGSWKPGMEQLLPFVDLAICSADFVVPGGGPIWEYCQGLGVEKLAITHGGDAIEWWEATDQGMLSVPAVEVVDTLGAGDVFHGAFCYFYGQEKNFQESLRQAAIIASQSCTQLGARSWMIS